MRIDPKGTPASLAILAAMVALFASTVSAWPPGKPASAAALFQAANQTGVTVSGEGEARAEPDLAVVSVGVTHVAPAAREAMNEVSGRLAAVIAGAKDLGVQDRDVQTSGLSLQPIFRARIRGDDSPPEIEGYRASNSVSLTVRDLASASAVLDSATQNGANVIGGLRFGISNVDELRAQALAAATANAEARARAIASAAGVSLRGVISITEEGVAVPRAQAEALGLRAAPAVDLAPPIEAGEMVVRARVRVSYSIEEGSRNVFLPSH